MLTAGFSLKDIPCPGHCQKHPYEFSRPRRSWNCNSRCSERDILQSDAWFNWPWKQLPEGYHQVYYHSQSLNQQQLEHWQQIYSHLRRKYLSRSAANCSSRSTNPFTSTKPVFFWSSKGSTFIGSLSKQDEPLKQSLGDSSWLLMNYLQLSSLQAKNDKKHNKQHCLPLSHIHTGTSPCLAFHITAHQLSPVKKVPFFPNRQHAAVHLQAMLWKSYKDSRVTDKVLPLLCFCRFRQQPNYEDASVWRQPSAS